MSIARDLMPMLEAVPCSPTAMIELLNECNLLIGTLELDCRHILFSHREQDTEVARTKHNNTIDAVRQKLGTVRMFIKSQSLDPIQMAYLRSRFIDVATRFDKVLSQNRDRIRDSIIKRYKISHPELSESELGELADTDGGAAFSGAAQKEILSEVRGRHNDIVKLEKSLNELRDIFLDMAILIDGQGTTINRIEEKIESGLMHVVEAKQELKQARKLGRSNLRRKICIGLGVMLVVLLAVGITLLVLL